MADTVARWQRFVGHTTFFSTGTDEHGLKIQQAAARNGMKPREFCDKVSQRFRLLVEKSGSQPDVFVRTSEERHATAVTTLWKLIEKNGYIYKGFHEGWYSVSDES